MKMKKSISLLESNSGDTQFVTKAPIPGRTPETASSPGNPSGVSALGSRSLRSNVEDGNKKPFQLRRKPQNNPRAVGVETAATEIEADDATSLPAGVAVSDVVSQNALVDVLAGVLSRHNPKQHNATRCNIFRDMYWYDATCGSAIDLLAKMPFSEFSLVGLKDEKMTKTFVESIEAINVASLLPNIAVDYNVLGAVVLSTRWDDSEKVYKGIAAHKLDLCTFTQVPVFGVDPIISVAIPPELLEGLRSQEIVDKYLSYIPDDLLADNKPVTGTGIRLKAENTIFIPRRGMLKDYSGTSLLQRALPAWLYEKALMRGTLDQVQKRQRAIQHVTVEGNDDWVPDQSEMNAISQLFLNADLDPLGAVVVTRAGVNVNEIRRGDDFWRWDSNFDTIEKIKLRALGISETFVSGDANYSTMEQTLSVFMENVRDFRNQITREIFYEKMFPAISAANGYTRKRYGGMVREVANNGGTQIYYDRYGQLQVRIAGDLPRHGEYAAIDPDIKASEFVVPQVAWHKRLMPEADEAYLSVLSTLEEKGVPVSIRHWIAAGGFKTDALIDGFEEDLKTREKIYEYKQELKELEKEYGLNTQNPIDGGGDGGDMNEEFASYLAERRAGVLGSIAPRSILSRGNPDHPTAEIADFDSQGRRRVMTRRGRQFKLNRYNKVIAEACSTLAQKENARTKQEEASVEKTKKIYT